jgi:hypothetical protein
VEDFMTERETKLDAAKVRADEARAMLGEIENLHKKALLLVPGVSLFHTKTQRTRSEQWDKIMDRLHAILQEPINLQRNFEYQDQAAAKKIEEAKKIEAGKESAAKYAAFQQEAVQWLLAKGKKLGEDFAIIDAVDHANELAYDEEIARMKASGGFIDFNGKNCDGPCGGWDMSGHRCDCGNRRVSFTTGYSHSFKQPHVYAEAY